MAFGSTMIEFGEDLSRNELVEENTATQRGDPLLSSSG